MDAVKYIDKIKRRVYMGLPRAWGIIPKLDFYNNSSIFEIEGINFPQWNESKN
jgi:hypothetical protein